MSAATVVGYEVNVCDPAGYGEEFADQIVDACTDDRSVNAAIDGLIVAVRCLDANIIDLRGDQEDLACRLVGLSGEQLAKLQRALTEVVSCILENP